MFVLDCKKIAMEIVTWISNEMLRKFNDDDGLNGKCMKFSTFEHKRENLFMSESSLWKIGFGKLLFTVSKNSSGYIVIALNGKYLQTIFEWMSFQ